MNNKKTIVICAIILYVLSASISYGAFRAMGIRSKSLIVHPTTDQANPDGSLIDPGLPKTETCPLNGKLYTVPEREIWETRRPLGVMIENSTDARPHSGISKADIVYEAVAEGGITRFLSIFYCGVAQETEVAPVRSIRTYFKDWVSEYSINPLIVHVGGANCSAPSSGAPCNSDIRAQAIEQMHDLGWVGRNGNDLDQIALSYPICYRNPDRIGRPIATEHTMVCNTGKLYDEAERRGWTNANSEGDAWDENFTAWKFKTESPQTSNAKTINMYFWKGYDDYNVTWNYNADQNDYERVNGGVDHMDNELGKQLRAKNIVVEFAEEIGPVDELKHLLYKTIGTGDALIFQDGIAIKGTWSKKSRQARTLYYDAKGKEIQFNPGVIWIELIPTGNEVTY